MKHLGDVFYIFLYLSHMRSFSVFTSLQESSRRPIRVVREARSSSRHVFLFIVPKLDKEVPRGVGKARYVEVARDENRDQKLVLSVVYEAKNRQEWYVYVE